MAVDVYIDKVDIPDVGSFNTVSGGDIAMKTKAFAGKGTSKIFRDAPRFLALYGGKLEEWQKMRGEVVIDFNGLHTRVEVHWGQEDTVGYFETKYKRTLI